MSSAFSPAKIRLVVERGVREQNIRVWSVFTVPRSTSSYPRKSGQHGGALPVACYLIVLLVRRDAPSWSRFSPPWYVLLPFTPAPFLLCHRCSSLSANSALSLSSRAARPFTLFCVLCQHSLHCQTVRLSYESKAGLVRAYERAIKLSSFPPT